MTYRKDYKRWKPAGLFSLEVTKILIARRISNIRLVDMLRARGFKGTRQSVDNYIGGLRRVEGPMVEAIGRSLELSEDRIVRLHRAAAIDLGYRVTVNGGLD